MSILDIMKSKAPFPPKKYKKLEALSCKGRYENVNVEKPKLIYDQNE